MGTTQKATWVENMAGLLPCTSLFFVLSAMFVLDARREHHLGGDKYLLWLNQNDILVRTALPFILVVVFAYSALAIVKNWRAFAIFPEFLEIRMSRPYFLWPFGLLYITYFGTLLAYGHYVWVHESCTASDSIAILMQRAVTCAYDPNRFMDALLLAGDQFWRGLWGDFWELIGPTDPVHVVQKDVAFILVTGFYRLLAQTALFVIPASLVTGFSVLFRRVGRQR